MKLKRSHVLVGLLLFSQMGEASLQRLSCEFGIYASDSVLGENNPEKYPGQMSSSSKLVGFETAIEYQRQEGSKNFQCVLGCENPVWQQKHRELPASRIALPKGAFHEAEIGFPELSLSENVDVGNVLNAKYKVRIVEDNGGFTDTVIEDSTPFTVGKDNILAGDNKVDYFKGSFSMSSEEKAQWKGRTEIEYSTSSFRLDCYVIGNDLLSHAEIAELLQKPAKEGFISKSAYDESPVTQIFNDIDKNGGNDFFSDALAVARRLDPDHRKASLADLALVGSDKQFLPRLRDSALLLEMTLNDNPNLTNREVAQILSESLGIQFGLNFSSVFAANYIALVMVDEEQSK